MIREHERYPPERRTSPEPAGAGAGGRGRLADVDVPEFLPRF
jgi:hypothetical protein